MSLLFAAPFTGTKALPKPRAFIFSFLLPGREKAAPSVSQAGFAFTQSRARLPAGAGGGSRCPPGPPQTSRESPPRRADPHTLKQAPRQPGGGSRASSARRNKTHADIPAPRALRPPSPFPCFAAPPGPAAAANRLLHAPRGHLLPSPPAPTAIFSLPGRCWERRQRCRAGSPARRRARHGRAQPDARGTPPPRPPPSRGRQGGPEPGRAGGAAGVPRAAAGRQAGRQARRLPGAAGLALAGPGRGRRRVPPRRGSPVPPQMPSFSWELSRFTT